ncbi:MAG: hypothetical protein FWB96_07980 [Defluviitaleaceae bacterium]|nr:hypothetical protein [Defluviitaleaceae bacterium]MCL2262850.1 hypothetical protein [Defluviitaleaceae bacterium]
MNAHDFCEAEIIRTQSFASANKTSVSISPSGLRFGVACIRKLPETEYVEIKVHPYEKILAILPCTKNHKNKIRWAKICDAGISVRAISAGAFLDTLYELFGWDREKRYRLRGEILRYDKEIAALFDAKKPEIFSSRYEFEMPWATSFGEDFLAYKNSCQGDVKIKSKFYEFDKEPDLRPTSQKSAAKNIREIMQKVKNGSDSNAPHSCI